MAEYRVKPHHYPGKFKTPIEEINARSLEKWTREHLIDESWHALNLQASWVNYGTYVDAEYRKTAHGHVHVRGMVKNGTTTVNTVLATLPYGYRPARPQVFLCPVSGGGYCDFTINAQGQLVIGTGWSATWTTFDVLFPTD